MGCKLCLGLELLLLSPLLPPHLWVEHLEPLPPCLLLLLHHQLTDCHPVQGLAGGVEQEPGQGGGWGPYSRGEQDAHSLLLLERWWRAVNRRNRRSMKLTLSPDATDSCVLRKPSSQLRSLRQGYEMYQDQETWQVLGAGPSYDRGVDSRLNIIYNIT